jgi:hypothetical protein
VVVAASVVAASVFVVSVAVVSVVVGRVVVTSFVVTGIVVAVRVVVGRVVVGRVVVGRVVVVRRIVVVVTGGVAAYSERNTSLPLASSITISTSVITSRATVVAVLSFDRVTTPLARLPLTDGYRTTQTGR